MTNSTISDFNSCTDDASAETEEPAQPETITEDDVTVDQDAFPQEYEWSDDVVIHHDVAAMVPLDEKQSFSVETRSTPRTINQNQVAMVVTGADALKTVSDDSQRVYPPSTYGEFTEFEPYYARATNTFSSSRYGGWGIPADILEAAVRFITGGGRYNAANITITALDFRVGWLIEYGGDTFLFSYTKVGPSEETVETHDVNGITIENEGNPSVLNGVEDMMDVLPELGITITGFNGIPHSSLQFETDQDKPISFNASQLQKSSRPERDLSELEGTHQIELYHQDAVYEYTWEEGATKYEPGDVIDPDGTSSRRLVLGYTKHEKRVQRGLRPDKYTVGKRITATPWFLKISPEKSDSVIRTQLYSSNSSEIIAEVPFDVPDHPNPEDLDEIKTWNPNAEGLNL